MDSMLEVLKNNPYWIEHVRLFEYAQLRSTKDPYRSWWQDIDPIVDGFSDFCYSAMKPLPIWIKSVEDLETAMADEEKIFVLEVPYCSFSDYSGCTVERSNFKDMEDGYSNIEGFYTFTGDCGTQAVAIDLRAVDIERMEEICGIIGGLENYPVIDESTLSEVEMEIEGEAWESFGRSDFRDSLEKAFKDFLDDQEDLLSWYYGYLWDISDIDDEKYDTLFREACEQSNHYPIFEEGGSCWFYPDDNAEAVTLDQFKALIGYDKIPIERYPMRPIGKLIGELEHTLDVYAGNVSQTDRHHIVRLMIDAIQNNIDARQSLIDALKE